MVWALEKYWEISSGSMYLGDSTTTYSWAKGKEVNEKNFVLPKNYSFSTDISNVSKDLKYDSLLCC